jgi:IS30 family transposase
MSRRVTPDEVAKIKELAELGYGRVAIARRMNRTPETVGFAAKRNKITLSAKARPGACTAPRGETLEGGR